MHANLNELRKEKFVNFIFVPKSGAMSITLEVFVEN